jgi:predicted molibdopterin-dependent oxidoreductase YjgC
MMKRLPCAKRNVVCAAIWKEGGIRNMPEITLTIDGRAVSAEAGATVFQVAKRIGIHIPHLCYREDLSPTSGCRLCIVEVEGLRNLAASCSLPVSNNMVVRTDTPRVMAARRMVLEFLLSDHPNDCMTCEKSGACTLEKYIYQFGIKRSRFEGERHAYLLRSANPFYERDYNKCILCARCVTVCHEIQYCAAVDQANRGFDTKVSAFLDSSMQESTCVFCGNCVSVCPTGALSEKGGRFEARQWETRKVNTICSYCGVGCTLVVNTKDDKVLKITSDKDRGVNKGWTCVKGRFGFDYVHSPDRLLEPLMRKDGVLEQTDWETALNAVSDGLRRIKKTHGPDSIAFLVSAKCTSEENYLLQKLARAVIGTNNVDHCARL